MLGVARTDTSLLGRWWWTVDRVTLALLLSMMAAGVVLVIAASPPVAERIGLAPFHFVERHLVYLAAALALLLGASIADGRWVRRIAGLTLLAALAGMILTLLIGPEIKGATRWLHLAGVSVQPSEFVKPAFAVMSAWFLALRFQDRTVPGYAISFALYAVIVGLLLLQPDLGMAVVVTGIWGAQLLLAGLPLAWLPIGVLLCGLAAFGAYHAFPHVQSRVDRFLDPSSGDTYQISRSLEAFANGGVAGVGPGQGEVKFHLPDAHADFAFAVAGEEFGLIAALLIVLAYVVLILRVFDRMSRLRDLFALFAVGGLMAQLGLQALVHMASALHLAPTKGMTLPFMSYGGSSLLALALGCGIVLALTRRGDPAREEHP